MEEYELRRMAERQAEIEKKIDLLIAANTKRDDEWHHFQIQYAADQAALGVKSKRWEDTASRLSDILFKLAISGLGVWLALGGKAAG